MRVCVVLNIFVNLNTFTFMGVVLNFLARRSCVAARENFFTLTLAENLMFMGDKFESLFNWGLVTFRRSFEFDLL